MSLRTARGRAGIAHRTAHAHILQHAQRRAHAETRACARSSDTGLRGRYSSVAGQPLRCEMSELPGESSVLDMGAASVVCDVLQAGVGGGSRAQEARQGPVADAARPVARVLRAAHTPIPSDVPGPMSVPDLHQRVGLSGVGGGSRAQEARQGPVADAARPVARVLRAAHTPIPSDVPGPMSVPDLHQRVGLVGINQQRLFRHHLDNYTTIPVRLLRGIEGRRRLFVESCKAREAAFDANPPQMGLDAAAFTLALAASEAISPPAD
ncbi:PREDICTED: EP300-interacting inhibitor of differentiation 2B [Galeopterus variegatus]|uniref:EP300-interacting inhibitor of differentiation 2B n=1 Tax=Galeopterus variegatus TaxID=482537 RepID=A0ABM0RJG3_GALVR|nr:PREDICTED: EP300-interacting inhibitor of differentiation 2B [Galeopterus variegatus]